MSPAPQRVHRKGIASAYGPPRQRGNSKDMNTLPARAQKLMRPDGTAPRVLVVDDEHNLTEVLSMALR